MQKPETIRYREFVEKFQTLLNESDLPAFVVLTAVREAIVQLEAIDERQYQRDLKEWTKAVCADGEQADQ